MNRLFTIGVLLLMLFCGCKQQDSYIVMVNNVEGLENGSAVICEGLTVGEVSDMQLHKDSVSVKIKLSKDFKLPVHSKFRVVSSMIGISKLIVERSDQSKLATLTDTLRGYKDTGSIFSSVVDTAKRKRMEAAVQKMKEGFVEFIDAAKKDSTKP
jgi:hypothetical protein